MKYKGYYIQVGTTYTFLGSVFNDTSVLSAELRNSMESRLAAWVHQGYKIKTVEQELHIFEPILEDDEGKDVVGS